MQLKYPKNWIEKEGERPHIVKKFSMAGNDKTVVIAVLNITQIPDIMSIFDDDEIVEILFSDENIKSFVPQNSEILLSKPTNYDGEPGYIIYLMSVNSQAGMDILSLMCFHLIYYKKATIAFVISYSIIPSISQKEISKEDIDAFIGLSLLMGNSIILIDKYE